MPDPLDGYYVAPAPTTDAHYDMQGHLNNAAALSLFNDLRIGYITHVVGGAWPAGLDMGNRIFAVADLFCSFLSEGFPGESYLGGTRIIGRTRVAWCYDQVLVAEADRRVLARARVVHLVVDRAAGGVVPVPEEFWALVEQAEGHPIPPAAQLPVPRLTWD